MLSNVLSAAAHRKRYQSCGPRRRLGEGWSTMKRIDPLLIVLYQSDRPSGGVIDDKSDDSGGGPYDDDSWT